MNSIDWHHEAEQGMGQIDRALAEGDYAHAARLAKWCARFEDMALQLIPEERLRTRLIIIESRDAFMANMREYQLKAQAQREGTTAP